MANPNARRRIEVVRDKREDGRNTFQVVSVGYDGGQVPLLHTASGKPMGASVARWRRIADALNDFLDDIEEQELRKAHQ